MSGILVSHRSVVCLLHSRSSIPSCHVGLRDVSGRPDVLLLVWTLLTCPGHPCRATWLSPCPSCPPCKVACCQPIVPLVSGRLRNFACTGGRWLQPFHYYVAVRDHGIHRRLYVGKVSMFRMRGFQSIGCPEWCRPSSLEFPFPDEASEIGLTLISLSPGVSVVKLT